MNNIKLSFAKSYIDQACIRINEKKYKNAIDDFNSALEIVKAEKFKTLIPFLILNIGALYLKLNEKENALKAFSEGENFLNLIGETSMAKNINLQSKLIFKENPNNDSANNIK